MDIYIRTQREIVLSDVAKSEYIHLNALLKITTNRQFYSKLIFQYSKVQTADEYWILREKGKEADYEGDIQVQRVMLDEKEELSVLWYIPHVAELAMVLF
jgi:hypothetical protein